MCGLGGGGGTHDRIPFPDARWFFFSFVRSRLLHTLHNYFFKNVKGHTKSYLKNNGRLVLKNCFSAWLSTLNMGSINKG